MQSPRVASLSELISRRSLLPTLSATALGLSLSHCGPGSGLAKHKHRKRKKKKPPVPNDFGCLSVGQTVPGRHCAVLFRRLRDGESQETEEGETHLRGAPRGYVQGGRQLLYEFGF